MRKIAICDDDSVFIELLKLAVKKALDSYTEIFEIFEYVRGEDLLEAAAKEKFSLIFLDIEMPEIDGYKLANNIRILNAETYIIFVSGHDNLVFRSYEYEPLWFIRKSEMEEMVPKAIEKFIQKAKFFCQKLQYRSDYKIFTIYMKNILYIEGSMHTLNIHLINDIIDNFKVYGTLKKEENRLQSQVFLRIHRNYLVNMKYVEVMEENSVTLVNGERLPVSKDRKAQVKEKLLEVF